MRFSGETERSKRSESINQDGQKQDGKKLNKMAAVLLLTIFALVSGCSGKKDQKAIIDALNKGMNHDRIMVYLPLGRVGPACSSLNVESKPVPDQVVYAGAQKAGLITITPDGPNFWKVELVNPTPQMTDAFKRVSHNTKDGCDAMALSFSIANKKVAEIQNVHKIADNQSEVEFTWKWTLVSFGPKFVNALSSRELAGLNEHLRNPVLDQHFDPSFNIADMAQTGAPQTAKMIVTKSGNDLEAELSSDGKIAEAKRKYEALQAQLTQLENSMPKPGEWVRAAATDKMDGSESVQFKTFSENKVQLSEGEERLLLAIGCDQHLHLYIEPGSVAASGVRYKFDTATAVRDTWSAGDQLLVKSLLDRDFLKHMVGARNMKIEFTPLGKEPQIASFDMGNFKQLVENEKGCNFMKKAWAF